MGTRRTSTFTPTGLHLPTAWPSAPKLLPCGEREGRGGKGRRGMEGRGWDGMGSWEAPGLRVGQGRAGQAVFAANAAGVVMSYSSQEAANDKSVGLHLTYPTLQRVSGKRCDQMLPLSGPFVPSLFVWLQQRQSIDAANVQGAMRARRHRRAEQSILPTPLPHSPLSSPLSPLQYT